MDEPPGRKYWHPRCGADACVGIREATQRSFVKGVAENPVPAYGPDMKQISYNGEMLITGTETSDALVYFVTHATQLDTPVAVEVLVLEENSEVASHTLVLSASTQLHVTETDFPPNEDENEQFPIPLLLMVGIRNVQPIPSAEVPSAVNAVGLDLDFDGDVNSEFYG